MLGNSLRSHLFLYAGIGARASRPLSAGGLRCLSLLGRTLGAFGGRDAGETPAHQSPAHQSPAHQSPAHQSPAHQSPAHQTPSHQTYSATVYIDSAKSEELACEFTEASAYESSVSQMRTRTTWAPLPFMNSGAATSRRYLAMFSAVGL